MQLDYCLFLSTDTRNLESAAIRFRTECEWSHVGFLRTKDGWTFSAMCDGLGVNWRGPNPNAKMLKLAVTGVEAALSRALTQYNKPYDKLDILGIALDRDWHTPNSFICSTLVLWAFEQIGIPLLNPTFIPREHLTPRDILLSPYVSEIKGEQ